MMPCSASTTKPVACPVRFHSVSKARGASTRMETTEGETRARVAAQACSVPAAEAGKVATRPERSRKQSSRRFMVLTGEGSGEFGVDRYAKVLWLKVSCRKLSHTGRRTPRG